jgi:hypothetical protein
MERKEDNKTQEKSFGARLSSMMLVKDDVDSVKE